MNTQWFAGLAVLTVLMAAGGARARAESPTFDVRRYGAVGDGRTMDTAALQQAIDAAAQAGGGTVLFPPGTYLSGSLHLKSHVTLNLATNATLLGSPHHRDYQRLNFHGLVLADGQEDIGLCGKGTLDGQGRALAADTARLHQQGVLPAEDESQRPVLINFRDCKRVTVRDLTLKDSACWVQDYLHCEHLTLENLTVRSIAAYNNDGIDIDGCTHVVVRGCDIDAEDDGICLKSSETACEDVLVENCRVRSSCNGLKFGTGSVAGFKNIVCRNLTIYDTYISALALEIVDGGEMKHVRISDIHITDSNNPLFVRLGHRNVHGPVGSLHDVVISNVTAQIPDRPASQFTKFPEEKAGKQNRRPTLIPAALIGLPGHPVQDITLQNFTLVYGGMGKTPQPGQPRLDSLAKVPERASSYPEVSSFGPLPAWGIYCRHTAGLRFTNITLQVQGSDYRPALLCDDAQDLVLDGFHALSAGSEPVIVLNDVQGATIRNSSAPATATRFLQTLGSTRDVIGP